MSSFFQIADPFGNENDSPTQCEILGDFGLMIQFLLGALSFGSLFLKRLHEYPKRSYRIFLLDISKQGISAFWCHVLNMMIAVYLQLKVNKGNGCEWYFINYVGEIALSVLLSYCIHSVILHFADKYDILILQSGVYLSIHDAQYIYRYSYADLDKHINYKVWWIQLTIWVMIVTISKITVFGIEYWFAEEFITLSILVLSRFHGHPKLELIFVMMIVPFTLNCL